MLKRAALIFFLLPMVWYGCQKPADDLRYRHVADRVLPDSTCSWLADAAHFHSDAYYGVFDAYYSRQLMQHNHALAAAALSEVAEKEMYYQMFRPATFDTIQTFGARYSTLFPWDKTLFVDSYTGNYYIDKTMFRKAIGCFARVASHQPFDYNSCTEVAHGFGDMAFCYSAMGQHELALQSNLKALALFNQTDNLTGRGGIYDNLALVNLYTKNYAEAETWFNKAMDDYQAAGDTSNMFTSLHNKILLYEETGDPRRYTLIDSVYRLFAASGLNDASLEIAFGTYYVEKLLHDGKTAKAKVLLDGMKLLADELASPSADADYLIALAEYEIKTGEGIANTATIEKALAVLEADEAFENQISFSELLKKDAILKGDYKKALMYSEKEKAALNGLTNRVMIAKTMELNKKHETEKKEQHILLQQQTIRNKNSYIALLIAVLGVFCLGAVIIRTRQRQKKIRADSQRALLYTRQLLEKTEEERKRIAGDLHDSVSHELLTLKNAIGPQAGSEAGAKIDAIINDIRSISRNLHPIMFEKVGLGPSIQQLVERTQAVHDLMVTADIDYDNSLPTADELQVYRMVQEALSNTIKYAEAHAAKIIIESRPEGLHIEVKDNGKGFDVAATLNSSTAFGLHNIMERSKAIGGHARISSDKQGTLIIIDIKKHL